ncbi:uncharacterized protein OCT59_009389 [Rhizophagus irregularis]|uniref:uncharacterized protein n=1 Tax=Rhizophagus irregularis TaxID=588596 RepID=UPI000CA6F461|nr:hypothetical protein OCT59_009389 [Rhizophagus irregularis]
MDQQSNYKLKTDFLISSDVPLNHPTQTTPKSIFKKCNECKRRRKVFNETDQICYQCYKAKKIPLSGNKVIDDFIKFTLTNYCKKEGGMEFVPYEKFKDIEFIAEGGFSRIYKATWIDGPIINWDKKNQKYDYYGKMKVALKELNNSENINSRELNELKGDLAHYIADNFFNYSWEDKLCILRNIASGLENIHDANIIHKDYHSGNIFVEASYSATTGDLGLSKSAIESLDDENEIYGIIPYVAPEVLQGQKYTKASDIYSFGMIMWELMTGRRPFWDKNHDAELIIEICDGVRPPIVTNAPEGYVELIKECWHSDSNKRPTANDLSNIFSYNGKLDYYKEYSNYPTKIIKSPDIGPIVNNPNAVYKSRPLSAMVKSAESTRSLKIQRYKSFNEGKRMINDNSIEDTGNSDKIIKKIKLNKNDDYLSKELEFDIDNNNINISKFNKFNNSDYSTKEIGFDI